MKAICVPGGILASFLLLLISTFWAGAQSCDPAPSGIIGWWPGEGNANDIIGTNNGILDNGATFTEGVVGEAFHFNGSNQDVQIPYSTILEPTNITVECWVKLDALASPVAAYPGLQYIVFKQNSRTGNFEGYDLEKNRINGQDVFRFQVTSADGEQVPAASTTIPQPGIWYHLAGTYDGTTVKIYVNGVLEGTAVAGFPMDYGTEPVYFGTSGAWWDGRLDGSLDEVSIYNRVLSSNEIASIYQADSAGKCPPSSFSCDSAPSGIVAWWPAEGNADDIIGGNNGVVTNGTVGYAPAEVGLGFNFDGGPNRLIVPDSPSLDIGPNVDFAVEGWIRAFPGNTPQGVMTIADKRYAPNNVQCQGYEVSLFNGQLNLRISDDPSGNGNSWSAGPNLLDGQLHHIAVSVERDSTTGGNLYVDGTNILQFDPTSVEGDLTTSQPLRIGNHPDPTYMAFFDGQIDELSLYKRALSSNEVAAIYHAGSGGKCPPAPTAPYIVIQPASQTVRAGGAATFSVVAGGNAPLSYKWYFDGTRLVGTNSTLTLDDVSPADAGRYQVFIGNAYGSTDSVPATLTITFPTCDPAPSGIVAWWPGDGNTDDIIGGNNGVVTNGTVGYAPAEVGLGFNFDGGPNRLIVPDAPSLDIGSNVDFTIEGWIRALPGNTPQGVMTIADKRYLPYSYQCQGYEVSLLYGQLNLRMSDNFLNNGNNWSAGPNLQDGQLHHIAVSVERDSTTGGHLYVDGTNVLQFDPTSIEGDLTTSQPLRIGNHPDPTYMAFFDGQIDELSLYKRALSSSEIAAIYQAGSDGKCPPTSAVPQVTHFAWSPIPSPQFRDIPFIVKITAQDAANAIVTNYMGFVRISSTNHVPVFPPISGGFVRGAWTGRVIVPETATNVLLIARDFLGQSGISDPFNVLARPVLTPTPSHGKWQFTWPTATSGFELEMTTNLVSGKWVPVPGQLLRSGDQYIQPITPTSTNSQVFYRLHYIGQ